MTKHEMQNIENKLAAAQMRCTARTLSLRDIEKIQDTETLFKNLYPDCDILVTTHGGCVPNSYNRGMRGQATWCTINNGVCTIKRASAIRAAYGKSWTQKVVVNTIEKQVIKGWKGVISTKNNTVTYYQ
jgi:hypothetical protein